MLTRPLRATGGWYIAAPAHLEKITLEPQAESLVVDGDQLTLIDGGRPPPRVIDLDGEPSSARWWMPCAARCPAISLRCGDPMR